MKDSTELLASAKSGDESATEELISKNSALVISIVRRYLGRGVDFDDLYQLGCLGLLKAIRAFDESLGFCFSTYAVPKIAGEIRRFLRDDGTIKVSRTIKEQSIKIKSASEKLTFILKRAPTISEISAETGLTIEEIAQAENASLNTASLSEEINEDGIKLEDLIASDNNEERTIEYILLSDSIKKLPKRERTVIILRFFKCLTQMQTAKILNISQVQVSRTEKNAIKLLKEKML